MEAKCKFCGNKFEAQRKSARFCSTHCRVMSARGQVHQMKGKVVKEVPDFENQKKAGEMVREGRIDIVTDIPAKTQIAGSVSPNDLVEVLKSIDPPTYVREIDSELPSIKELTISPSWYVKIEDYCAEQGITADDLIEFHRNQHKKPEKVDNKPVERAANGVKMIDPPPGTNAYFLKYNKWR